MGDIDDVISSLQKISKKYSDAIKIEVKNSECCGSEDCDYYGCSCTSPEVHITRLETNAEVSNRLAAEEKEKLRQRNAEQKEARRNKKKEDLRKLEEAYEEQRKKISSRY